MASSAGKVEPRLFLLPRFEGNNHRARARAEVTLGDFFSFNFLTIPRRLSRYNWSIVLDEMIQIVFRVGPPRLGEFAGRRYASR